MGFKLPILHNNNWTSKSSESAQTTNSVQATAISGVWKVGCFYRPTGGGPSDVRIRSYPYMRWHMRTRRLVAGIVMVPFGTLAMLGHALAQDERYPVEWKVGRGLRCLCIRADQLPGDQPHLRRASAVGVYRLWRDAGYAFGALLSGIIADLLGVVWAIVAVGDVDICFRSCCCFADE